MAVPFSNTKLRVPNGFRGLLWVLSKEVIRDTPANVTTYCAEFMGKLLKIRADSGHDPVVDGAHSENLFYNKYVFIEVRDTTSQPLQAQPGQSSAQPAQPAQTPSARDKGAKPSGAADKMAASGGQSGQDDDIDIDLNDPEVEKAANMIQAQFRGHFKRGHKE